MPQEIGIVAAVGSVIVMCVFMNIVSSLVRTWQREKTRREIAAYIAEGSMTPEQGERLMRAGVGKQENA